MECALRPCAQAASSADWPVRLSICARGAGAWGSAKRSAQRERWGRSEPATARSHRFDGGSLSHAFAVRARACAHLLFQLDDQLRHCVVLLAQLVVFSFERLDVDASRRAKRHLDKVERVRRLLGLLVEADKHCSDGKHNNTCRGGVGERQAHASRRWEMSGPRRQRCGGWAGRRAPWPALVLRVQRAPDVWSHAQSPMHMHTSRNVPSRLAVQSCRRRRAPFVSESITPDRSR